MNTANKQDLLFELGCEELPPKLLLTLSNALLSHTKAGLQDAGLDYTSADCYATPRRLAIIVNGLNNTQPNKSIAKRGPAVQVAFTKDGTPSQAAIGFAKSCDTHVENLNRLKTDKGEWLVFKQTVKGLSAKQLLPNIIQKSIASLPIAKKMRWGACSVEFVRPVHWCVLLLGSNIIHTHILGLKTGNQSQGHRFHAPHKITINNPAEYLTILEQQGKVIADFTRRQNLIKNQANALAKTVHGTAHIEKNLLQEITALNEWPVPILGNFDARFLNLPSEVLISTIQTNQKYFPIKNNKNQLLPHFITFSNIESSKPESVQQGNERVILPRLADAEFFWKQDNKQTLESRIPHLHTVVFQKTLGSLADKSKRVEKLSLHIAQQLNANTTLTKRAACLAKADLTTHIVDEFASLQGVMGHHYALAQNEPEAVAIAIEEQYFPKQANGPTPSTPIGQILAISEKIDTLSGIFSIGLIPTGDKDPYALRRATLGLLRIMIERKLDLDIVELLTLALAQYPHPFNKNQTLQNLLGFIFDRLKGYCLAHAYTADEFEAVIAVHAHKPLDFMQRLDAVKIFKQQPEAHNLIATNKRIINILKKSNPQTTTTISGLIAPQEKQLHQATLQVTKDIKTLLTQKKYQQALARLAQLNDLAADFFDNVMVNTDDLSLRASRIALLAMLSNQFLKIADISKLQ